MSKDIKDIIQNYDDDSILVIREDIKKIRKRVEPYIGYRGRKGFKHLIKEILQNAIDEYSCEESPCSYVKIHFDEKEKIVTIADNGRGIPPKSIVDIFTVLQAGGKFGKGAGKAYKFAAGENGVGTTVTNALSNFVNIEVQRNGTKTIVRFIDGQVVEEREEKCPKKEHGTSVQFQPSEKYLGTDINNLDYEEIIDLAKYLSFLAKGCVFLIKIKTREGKKIDKKIVSDNGIVDKLSNVKGRVIEPIYICYAEGDKKFEVALTYTNESDNEEIVSYANYCTTVDHGTHVIGFRQGLSNAFTRLVKENLTDSEKKTYSVISDDCKAGLCAVVNAYHENASFVGQVKEKINNDDLIPFCRNTTYFGLKKWMKDNPEPSKKILKHIKNIMKARVKSQLLRKNKITQPRSSFDFSEKFKPANGRNHLEIMVVEGDSAGGSANLARIRDYQALYFLKGIPKNPYGLSLLKIMANDEYRGFLTVAGVTGSKFDINKFPYERVIILTDADTDGNKITSLFSIFVMLTMPEVVTQGRLFKALPPLYKISTGKRKHYLIDNGEYNDFMQRNIGNSLKIFDSKGNRISINKFLSMNRYYMNELTGYSDRFTVHPYLIENLIDCDFKPKNIKNYIKKCRFLKYDKDKDLITGIFDKEYQYINLNEFHNKIKSLIDLYKDNNSCMIYTIEFENSFKRELTISQVLHEIEKYEPKNRTRYKGVGEMDPEELWETTLDPSNRTLIRLTTEDIQKDIDRFSLLHGDGIKMRQERKDMMSKFNIPYDELDN